MERVELELWHLISDYGSGGRVGLLVLRKLFCSGYVGVKQHGGLQWACFLGGVDLVIVYSLKVWLMEDCWVVC